MLRCTHLSDNKNSTVCQQSESKEWLKTLEVFRNEVCLLAKLSMIDDCQKELSGNIEGILGARVWFIHGHVYAFSSVGACFQKLMSWAEWIANFHDVIASQWNVMSWRHIHGDGCFQTPIISDYQFNFILWLTSLPVYNGYYGFNKVSVAVYAVFIPSVAAASRGIEADLVTVHPLQNSTHF